MAWIQAFSRISSKTPSRFHLPIFLKPFESPYFGRRTAVTFSHFSKNVHNFKFPNQKPLFLPRFNFTRTFSIQCLNKGSIQTLCTGNGKQVYFIKPQFVTVRWTSTQGGGSNKTNQTALIYIMATFIFMVGAAYAGVPLYKVFCQATGLGGQAIQKGHETEKIESMKKVERQIKIRFNADVASSMRWNFRPQQTEVTVLPGETALAFYTAQNPTDKPIIGISTYNVLPYDAGQYFNKIQCFCFEEQRLNPKEQVDMPVFFYIDPEFAEDPKLENVKIITLSYTFFEAKEGLQLPLPGYPQPHDPVVSTA